MAFLGGNGITGRSEHVRNMLPAYHGFSVSGFLMHGNGRYGDFENSIFRKREV